MLNLAARRWRDARTLADLGHLMALWTEGQIRTWPGHPGKPDPETADLVPILAACNRTGYLTTQSQPGVIGPGFDGLIWEQRAVVEGFIADEPLLARLRSAAEAAGLTVIVHGRDRSVGPKKGVTGTRRDGRDYTAGFGMRLARRHLGSQWPGISRDAFREITAAWQVTVVDPVWGRNDRLWPLLDRVVGGAL
jgi:hypothetical protein